MRVIIAKDGKNITYEHVSSVDDTKDGELILYSFDPEHSIHITLNGWLIAKVANCRIDKRCLVCVDEVFLDTRVEGL